MPTHNERVAHIELWKSEFGQRRRDTIETSGIDAVLNRWLAARLAASTVKHRRTALLHLWSRLDGKHAANPVRASALQHVVGVDVVPARVRQAGVDRVATL
jgi:hypothetical protein